MYNELLTRKDKLITIPETYNAQEALELLELNDLRLAPILDKTGTLYRGNVYRYHLYQAVTRDRSIDLSEIPVTRFLKNTSHISRLGDSIYELIFSIKDLPYLAILDKQNSFVGVIYHDDLKAFLYEAWAIRDSSYVLEVKTLGKKGELSRISRLINRYSDITSSMTMEQTSFNTRGNITFLLPKDISVINLDKIERTLTRKKYSYKLYKL